jgi:glycerol kinase
MCDRLRAAGLEARVREVTGLVLDAYFSGTKIRWLLDHTPDARHRAERGELAFGTVDSWLLWKLTGGHVHATDASNASRTLCLNLASLEWDDEMLGMLGIPRAIMPRVRSSAGVFGETAELGWLPSRGSRAISRRRCSVRHATSAEESRTPMERDASRSSTPAPCR